MADFTSCFAFNLKVLGLTSKDTKDFKMAHSLFGYITRLGVSRSMPLIGRRWQCMLIEKEAILATGP